MWDAGRAATESSRARARLQSEALSKILIGIGTVLNIPDPSGQKASWLPKTRIRFLGLLIDSAQECFLLPEDKRLDIMHLAETIMQQPQVSSRQLAQMAGKMIAAAPAVQLSKLYAGAMYKVMTRELDWDSMYPSSAALQADMECFRDTVAASTGGSETR